MLSKFGALFSRKAFASHKLHWQLAGFFSLYLRKTERRAVTQKRSVLIRRRKHLVRARNISKCTTTIRRQTNMAPTMPRSTTRWLLATFQFVQVSLFSVFESERNKISMLFFLSTLLNCAFLSFCRLYTKGKLALLKLNFKTAVLELSKTYRFAFTCPNTRVTCFIIKCLFVIVRSVRQKGEYTDLKFYFVW